MEWGEVGVAAGLLTVIGTIARGLMRDHMREHFEPKGAAAAVKADLEKTIVEVADASASDYESLSKKVALVERLSEGNWDATAANRGMIDKLADAINVLRQYGSEPTREMIKAQNKMVRQLDRLTIHMGLEPEELPDD